MKINVYMHQKNGSGNEPSYITIFHEIYNELIIRYPNIEFTYIDSNTKIRQWDPNDSAKEGRKFGHRYMIIENPVTKKYIVISYWDRIEHITLNKKYMHWDVENCVEIIESSGNPWHDIKIPPSEIKITPFAYPGRLTLDEEIINEIYNNENIKKKSTELSFRGKMYEFRNYLFTRRPEFKIKSIATDLLPIRDYLMELSEEYINLSLNGWAEICYRDIEILGLGNTLFRTELNTKFHNELIPNYHYVSVSWNDIPPTLSRKDFWDILAQRLLDRFNEVKNDIDYLKFVGENGRKWYEENGTIKKNVDLAINLIDLNKIWNS